MRDEKNAIMVEKARKKYSSLFRLLLRVRTGLLCIYMHACMYVCIYVCAYVRFLVLCNITITSGFDSPRRLWQLWWRGRGSGHRYVAWTVTEQGDYLSFSEESTCSPSPPSAAPTTTSPSPPRSSLDRERARDHAAEAGDEGNLIIMFCLLVLLARLLLYVGP